MEQNIQTGLNWLAGTLNRSAENGIREIQKSLIEEHLDYSYRSLKSNTITRAVLQWEDVLDRMQTWEKKGWIKILYDPRTADDNTVCLIMLKYLDCSPWIGGANLPSPESWF